MTMIIERAPTKNMLALQHALEIARENARIAEFECDWDRALYFHSEIDDLQYEITILSI